LCLWRGQLQRPPLDSPQLPESAVKFLDRIHVRSRRHLRAMTRAKCDLEVGTGMENPLYRKFLYGAAIREAKACGCSPEFWPEALKSL
jgi:hypothetical protein